MEERQANSPSVVPRSDIPIVRTSDDVGLEVRPFLAHKLLSSLLPPSAVSLAWTQARANTEVALRSHPTPGLLIILEGRANLVGGLRRPVESGDVITLPSHHEYGFTSVGAHGLHALHVAFSAKAPATPETKPAEASTFDELVAHNQVRMQIALNNSFFGLLRERGINTARKRELLRECLRVFSDAFQTFLFTRQAMCRDDEYVTQFHRHLLEELGHNELLSISGNSPISKDPVLRATSSWFCHQMLVLDNAEKAVVNLVLESAGYYLGTLAKPQFAGHESERYFDTHAEDDEHHKDLGLDLLQNQHPKTYRRLQRVLDSSWDMLEAMTQRFVRLIERDARSS